MRWSIGRIIGFTLWVLVSAVVGGFALVVLHRGSTVEASANDVRLDIQRVKAMAARIEARRAADGRLPTKYEIACDWQPCPPVVFGLAVWEITPEPDGSFALRYESLGMPLARGTRYVTLRTRDGTTDWDGWDQPWRWRVRHSAFVVLWVGVILLPWTVLGLRVFRRRRRAAPAT